jgi:hypothetical protein
MPAPGDTHAPILTPAPADKAVSPILPHDIAPLLSFSKPIKVEQTLDRAIITVGDLITYTMTIEAPEGLDVGLPPPGAQLGQFIIRDYEISEPETIKDRVLFKFIFTITAYTTGQLEVPPIPILINPQSKTVRGLITEGIQVRVASVTNPEDLEIRDVKQPLSIPLDLKPYLIAGAVALGLIALVAVALFYLRRYRPGREDLPAPLKPAHVLAYQELRELAAMRLMESGEVEAFYTKLSEIIRRYIALRFRIYALEFTTTEILEALKNKSLENRVYERVRWFLEETDLVKFAQYKPPESERSEVLERSREIIDWSREPDLVPVGEEISQGASLETKEENIQAP